MSGLHILVMHYMYNAFFCALCEAQLKYHQVTHIIPKAAVAILAMFAQDRLL